MDPIHFVTDDGLTLEGEIRTPDGPPRATAVICHPHPLKGGSKDHPILWAIRIELAHRRFTVLSFNFRGVMGSEGEFGRGVDEVMDARAAVGRVREEADGPTFVAGWSFGAHVALREALDDERVAGLALLGFPLAKGQLTEEELLPLPSTDRLKGFDRPVLLLSGEHDPFSPADRLHDLGRSLGNARVEIMAGTDHYLPRREREAGKIVAEFALELLEPDVSKDAE